MLKKTFATIFWGLLWQVAFGQQSVVRYTSPDELVHIAEQALVLEDKEHRLTPDAVWQLSDTAFRHIPTGVLNFENTTSKFWIRLHLRNATAEQLFLLIDNPEIQHLTVYRSDEQGQLDTIKSGALTPFSTRSLKTTPFSFALGHRPQTVLIEAHTFTGFTFPMVMGATAPIVRTLHRTDLFNGAYIGLMAAVIFYNLFLFFSVGGRTYLYYTLYIGISAFMMLRFRGTGFDLFWPDIPWFNAGSNLFPCLTVISSVLFSTHFLNMPVTAPRMNVYFWLLSGIAGVIIVTDILHWQPFSNIAFQIIGGLTAFSLLSTAIYIYSRGYKTAQYYIIAWTALLVLTIVLMLALNGILPVNFFTMNSFQIGSGLEAVLLSLALAQRINIIKAEREAAQLLAYQKMAENERLVKEQNSMLEQKVAERTAELQSEKEKSDALLLNILPEPIANELKISGKARPQRHENVTVMFIDIKDFTAYSERMPPEQLVEDIDLLFKGFDKVIAQYEVEKIKTIGDAYLCASGLRNNTVNHAQEILKTAASILDFVQQVRRERDFFDIRIGIHSGPVVAGVVGDTKFAYDIWGDTVNVAARMEQNSEAGKINISQDTCELVGNYGRFSHRGKINAKNKGEIDMYFWEMEFAN